ncbi:cyclin-dependent kinase 12-like [Huso huso]|uniref:Cyclin-dependent kinase 12-like n=1 Tax=Huso huso TaxID=61971 RepID=A0ABR0Z800_HUSHU
MAQVLAKKAGHLCPGQRALHSPPASAVLDETCCCRIMCQHPLCWEAHLRCARGVPRYTAARAEPPEPQEDGLPTLKIQNIPGWSDDDPDGTDPGPFPRTFNSSEPSHLTATHTKERSVIESSEVLHFPGRNSPRAPRTLLMSERGFSPDPFYEKLRQSESSPRDSNRTDSIVIWVPNPQRSSQRIKQPGQTNSKPALLLSGKSERICISELIYSLPPSQTDKAHKMKRKKPFKLSHSVSLLTGGRKMAKQSILAGHTERDSDVAQAEAVDPQPTQNKAARPKQQHGEQLLLHNRGVVLHSARGKKQNLEGGSGSGGFQYRLDDKSTDSPGKDKVDWESLGRQPLLWRRYLMSASRGKSKTAGPKSSRQLSQPLDPWVYSTSRDTTENIHPGQLPILEIGPALPSCSAWAKDSRRSSYDAEGSTAQPTHLPDSAASSGLSPHSTAQLLQHAMCPTSESELSRESWVIIPPVKSIQWIQKTAEQEPEGFVEETPGSGVLTGSQTPQENETGREAETETAEKETEKQTETETEGGRGEQETAATELESSIEEETPAAPPCTPSSEQDGAEELPPQPPPSTQTLPSSQQTLPPSPQTPPPSPQTPPPSPQTPPPSPQTPPSSPQTLPPSPQPPSSPQTPPLSLQTPPLSP